MSNKQLKLAIELLKCIEVGDFKKFKELNYWEIDKSCGLCTNILSGNVLHYQVINAVEEWEHFSGEHDFPIETEVGDGSEEYYCARNKYDRRTTYGKLRANLAGHIARYLQDYLDKD